MPAELREGEEVEFKRQWTDRALEDLAAFANTRGGTLWIGIEDDGTVVGAAADDEEIQRITNIITSRLGITPSVRVEILEGKEVIAIGVKPARVLVSCSGRYLRRVGSTNRDFSQDELARHILERSGQSWDALPSPWGIERVDPEAIAYFARLAEGRLPHINRSEPERVLQNLGLLAGDRLTNAGALLFAHRPQERFVQARVRIGAFRSPTEIVDSHDFGGTLWDQLDGVMERFRRILHVRFDVKATEPSVEGLQRRDVWEYPLDALREAVINALIHRDYTLPADIQIRVYDDRLDVWSPGGLPEGIRLDQLREPQHPSVPRNPLLAQAFYYAGLIERWGTGTIKIISLCQQEGLPVPEFVEQPGSFQVVFLKDIYTPERLRRMGLNERQIKAVLYVKEHGSVTNREYRELTAISERTATIELGQLVEFGIFERIGTTGRGTRYGLRNPQKAQ